MIYFFYFLFFWKRVFGLSDSLLVLSQNLLLLFWSIEFLVGSMASKHGPRTKRLSSHSSKAADSPASSGTSSTKQFLETSIDGQSSPASSSARSKPHHSYVENVAVEAKKLKENVTVTVRFRPLRWDFLFFLIYTFQVSLVGNVFGHVLDSPREIRQGEEIAWYADGETILRNEHNPSIAYAYGKLIMLSLFILTERKISSLFMFVLIKKNLCCSVKVVWNLKLAHNDHTKERMSIAWIGKYGCICFCHCICSITAL